MPRFAANLSMLWPELDLADRLARARTAGFSGVELQFPYAYEKERLADLIAASDLELVLHNMPPGNWEKGERGIACLPGRESEFEDGVGRAIDYARALGTGMLNCLAGIAPAGVAPDVVHRTLVQNLKFAAAEMKKAGLTFVVEAINTRDIPGFVLNRSAQTLAVLDEVGASDVFLQYDVYHMQVMEGDLTHTLATRMDRIRHIQVADVPDRGEPGTGEINFPYLFEAIDAAGYTGWIGAEYRPRGDTDEGLGWAAPYLRSETEQAVEAASHWAV